MYQSILFAQGETGKIKNDAMPPKVLTLPQTVVRFFHHFIVVFAEDQQELCLPSNHLCTVLVAHLF
jgi:hypothetical protein